MDERIPQRGTTAASLFGNSVFNIAAFTIVSASGFFVTPFVVGHLGPVTFGIYSLAVVVTGFVSILDFGLGVSAMKMIADRAESPDRGPINALVSTVFTFYTLIGLTVLAAGVALTPVAPDIFHIPASLHNTFRWCWILASATVGLTFAQAVYTATLNGMRDFALQNVLLLASTLLSIAGTVALLLNGHGVISIFVLGLVMSIAQFLVKALLVRGRHGVVPRRSSASWDMLRTVMPIASWVLVINVCSKLILDADILIAGLIIGPFAIAIYQVATSIAMVIRRTSEQFNVLTLTAGAAILARRDMCRLRILFIEVNRVTAVVTWPAAVLAAVGADRFLTLWVGPRIGHAAASSMACLVISMAIIGVQASSAQVLIALGKHKSVAKSMLLEAAANIVLSVILTLTVGVVGIAIGTLVPSILLTLGVILPSSAKALGVTRINTVKSLFPIFLQCAIVGCVGYVFVYGWIDRLGMMTLLLAMGSCYLLWTAANIFGPRQSRQRYKTIIGSKLRSTGAKAALQ